VDFGFLKPQTPRRTPQTEFSVLKVVVVNGFQCLPERKLSTKDVNLGAGCWVLVCQS
jgi:hypothetical protein